MKQFYNMMHGRKNIKKS